MRSVVITGVSTGIGYDATRYLIQNGYKVYGSVRKTADAQSLKKTFGDLFAPLIFDVKDGEAIKRAAEEVRIDLNGQYLAGIINNAGTAFFGPMLHFPVERLKEQFDINVFGIVRVCQAFSSMLGNNQNNAGKVGKIINISSVSGRVVNPFLGAYCASKFALEALNDALRIELKIYGIDVVCIQPGPVVSQIWNKAKIAENHSKGTDYEAMLDLKDKLIADNERRALSAAVISKKIYNILKNKKTRSRHLMTNQKILFRIFELLPARTRDLIIHKQLNKLVAKNKNHGLI